jgi:hypothetical protein
MDAQQVTLRKMTPAEYQAATELREAESVRVLSKVIPEELAWERVRRGTANFGSCAASVAGRPGMRGGVRGAGDEVGVEIWAGGRAQRGSA